MLTTTTLLCQRSATPGNSVLDISGGGLIRLALSSDSRVSFDVATLARYEVEDIGTSPAVTLRLYHGADLHSEDFTHIRMYPEGGAAAGGSDAVQTQALTGTIDQRLVELGGGHLFLTWSFPAQPVPGPGVLLAAIDVNGERSSHSPCEIVA